MPQTPLCPEPRWKFAAPPLLIDQTVQTDAEGRYLLSILPPGACDVTCIATGFQAQVKQGVVLMVAAQMAQNVEIPVGNALR